MTALAFRAPWAPPPPPPALFGELAQDRQRIILIGQGNGWDAKTIGTRLKLLTPALTVVDKASGIVSVPCTWPAVCQLASSFPGTGGTPRWVPGPQLCAWIVDELTRRTTLPGRDAYPELPPGLKAREYQDAAAAAIAQVGSFLIFDEPGVGKTIETIIGLEWRRRLGHQIFPCVIITPSWSVCNQWAREIAKWMPRWVPPVLHKGPGRRERLGLTGGVYLTTYATARQDAPDIGSPLPRLRPASVVLDEIHFCSNSSARQTQAAHRIARHAGTRVGLTGTPVTNATDDAWGGLCACFPEDFPSKGRFVKRLCEAEPDPAGYKEKVTGLKQLAAPEFFASMTGTMRRVTKKQVLDQLPDKIYTVRKVELPPEWRKAYDGLRDDMIAELPDGGELSIMETIAQVTFLGQLSCAAFDVEITEELDPETGELKKHHHAVLKRPSWKCDELMEILAERPGQPVVAFMPSKQLARIAGEMAAEQGRRTGYLTGLGNGMTEKKRQADIAAFTAGKLDLICATTGAGGTGIDGLQVSGTAVFLQRPWGLGKSVQAEDRLHRIGSEIHEKGVEIIDVVAEDTVDQAIRDSLVSKSGMAGEFLRDPSYVRELLGGLR